MPPERTTARKPEGPGRPPRRPRTSSRPASDAPRSAAAAPLTQLTEAAKSLPRRVSSFGFTRRAIVLFAVVSVLGLSSVGTIRVLIAQQNDLATAQQQIAERTARVTELDAELQRWRDPAYVKAQASTRLGWVMPGEIGYRVIGRDGQIISGSSEIEGIGSHTTSEFDPRWWDRLGGSIAAADNPDPVRR